ncbi:MAG: VWA domain-containing protein [Saprospiraceae bacterium]|nr:VWA domain-containing protein [Saprospiraceae bacterium]
MSLALLALSVASPVRVVKLLAETQMSADIVIGLDVSKSMLATDLKPNRLERAKSFILRLVAGLENERMGLLFFAGDAFPQMPLSLDHESLLMFVRNANPNFIIDQGTDLGAAVELGKRLLETDQATGRMLILITDGENHEEKAQQRILEAYDAGIQIFTVAAGTVTGGTIPIGKGQLLMDLNKKPVRTVVNEPLLKTLSQAGGGQMLTLEAEDQAVKTIKNAVTRLQKTATMTHARSEKVYFFPWLVLAALVLLITEQILWWKKSKRVLASILMFGCAFSAFAQSEHAALRSGEENYVKGNYAEALRAYKNAGTAVGNYNAGNAAVKANSLPEAIALYRSAIEKSTSKSFKADVWYNLGNALLLQKNYGEAIKAFESSLRLAPNKADAQKNLQIAKRMLQEPPPSPPPPPPPPPSLNPQRLYVDQGRKRSSQDAPPAQLPAETARKMLQEAILSEEQRNARAYRELGSAGNPSRLKKDW